QAIDYQRSEGYGGLRGDLGPEVFMPFHLGRALNGSFTGRLRETAYHLTDTEQVGFVVPSSGVGSHFRAAPELPRLDTDRSRELAEVSGRTGTEFVRVFDFRHFGFEKFRHSIEPELRYLFVRAAVGHGARRGADRRTARARAREHPSRLRHLPPDRGHQPRERHRPRDTADAGRLPGTLVQRDGQPRTLGDPRTDGRAVPARAV